jgi:hypothetical protein
MGDPAPLAAPLLSDFARKRDRISSRSPRRPSALVFVADYVLW